jgi:transposase-like protein
MNPEQQMAVRRRRTRREIQQLIAELANSGMDVSEFCRSRGLSRSTLYRHWKKRPSEDKPTPAPAAMELLAVEVAGVKRSSPIGERELAVVLANARRIEVNPGFDAATLARLVNVLERV